MKARGAVIKELLALFYAEIDPHLKRARRVAYKRFENVMHLLWDGCAAHAAETHQGFVVGDGQDSWNDLHIHIDLFKAFDIIVIVLIIKE